MTQSGRDRGRPGSDTDVVDQRQQLWVVARLSRRQSHRERAATAVDAEVVLVLHPPRDRPSA